jgi:hypothetical protein
MKHLITQLKPILLIQNNILIQKDKRATNILFILIKL